MDTVSKEDLLARIEELEGRLADAEQLIEAIKAGEVDAFALNRNNKPEIFTLQSGDYAYRMLIENVSEGALNLSEEGLIVYTNNYFAELLQLPYDRVIGNSIFNFVHFSSRNFSCFFFSVKSVTIIPTVCSVGCNEVSDTYTGTIFSPANKFISPFV